MTDEHGGDAAGYLGWFFLGAIAGAAAALLLTPKTGSETRELLTEHSQELLKKAQENFRDQTGAAWMSDSTETAPDLYPGSPSLGWAPAIVALSSALSGAPR